MMTNAQIALAHDLILEAEAKELRRFSVAERMEVLAAETEWTAEEICDAVLAVRQIEMAR
jgi:hypothetical protein